MRTTLSTRIASLLIQYSLVISFTVLPYSDQVTVHAQDKILLLAGPATPLEKQAAHDRGPTALNDEKRTRKSYLHQSPGTNARFSEVPSLAEKVMGFAGSNTPNDVSKLFANDSSADGFELEQGPGRPMPIPSPPGIGSGGTGPGGSFNVEAPERRQGPPEGVRSTSEVLTEAIIPRGIPDAVPSTQSYCWPGDPACRKPPPAKPKTPAPKPTPPPRPQGASLTRPELLVANNGEYVEKLMSSALPQLAHLWSLEELSPLHQLLTANRDQTSRTSALLAFASATRVRPESVSASSVWANCTNVRVMPLARS